MAAKRSAGIVVFRRADSGVEVLLAHPGGPFWAKRDSGAWSVPKGEYEDGAESPLDAARREFEEELGVAAPGGELLELGSARQSGGKVVTAWAVEGDLDPESVAPGTFVMEWPRGSGRTQQFPEVDRVAWFPLGEAGGKIVKGQRPLLERLSELLGDQ